MRAHPLEAFFKRLPTAFAVFIGVILAAGFILEHIRAQVPVSGGQIGLATSVTVASGTATMTTAAIAAAACGTTVTIASASVATTDTITWAFNAAPGGQNAGLVAWPTAGNVNFAYCSNTAETPAAATINWRVIR